MVLTLSFPSISSPLVVFLFLRHFFSSFAGYLVGVISVGKVFEKALSILELDEKKFR